MKKRESSWRPAGGNKKVNTFTGEVSYNSEALGDELVGQTALQALLLFGTGGVGTEAEAAIEGVSAAKIGGQSLVQANRTAGNLFRDELAAALRAEGRTVRTEAYKWTPFGKRFIDIDVRLNGVKLGGIETKVGSSRYLPLQKLKDAWLGANGYPVQLVRKPVNW